MTTNGNVFDVVVNKLKELSSEIADGRFRTTWSKLGDDTIVTVVSTVTDGDAMTIRVSDDVALLDLNSSGAIEFSDESEDIDALIRIVSAFYDGELVLIVGASNGKCYGVRVGNIELASSIGLIDRLRSGKRRVRAMR